MILTGSRILQAWQAGDVFIDPFVASSLNPNSYNYHLGDSLLEVRGAAADDTPPVSAVGTTAGGGFLLRPRRLYLAATHEIIGSRRYVTTLLGRSSMGRLGLFLNVTADLGHAGSSSRWTLELTVVQPLVVYPRMPIGQVAFWVQSGPPAAYGGRYHHDLGPVPNRDGNLSGEPAGADSLGSP
jgi:dCTP deaminase